MTAKAIDVDTSMFRPTLEAGLKSWFRYTGGKCSKHGDCDYGSCIGECDIATGTCTANIAGSNLHVSKDVPSEYTPNLSAFRQEYITN